MLEDTISTNISLRTLNQKRVLHLLYKEGALTQAEIKEKSGLSGPTVAQCIQAFKESGVFTDGEELASSGGRKPRTIAFNYNYRYAVGVEIRKHHIDACILNLKGDVIDSQSFRIVFELSDAYLKKANEMVEQLIARSVSRKRVLGISLAFPGEVSLKREKILRSTLLDIHHSISIHYLQQFFDLPLSLEYGPNAAAFGFAFKDENLHDLSYVVVTNDGVAGSIIIDNRIYRGQSGKAAAFGHVVLDPHGKKCFCGQNGCWSALCAVTTLTGEEEGDYSSFFRDIHEDDEKKERLDQYLRYMAQGIAYVRLCYDTDVTVGGKMVSYLVPYLDRLKEYVLAFPAIKDDDSFHISLDASSFSPMAEGAALILVSRFFDREDEIID